MLIFNNLFQHKTHKCELFSRSINLYNHSLSKLSEFMLKVCLAYKDTMV